MGEHHHHCRRRQHSRWREGRAGQGRGGGQLWSDWNATWLAVTVEWNTKGGTWEGRHDTHSYDTILFIFVYRRLLTNQMSTKRAEQSFHDEKSYPDICLSSICTSNLIVNGDRVLARKSRIYTKSCTISTGKFHTPPSHAMYREKSFNQSDKTTKTPTHDHMSLPPLAYATPECAQICRVCRINHQKEMASAVPCKVFKSRVV